MQNSLSHSSFAHPRPHSQPFRARAHPALSRWPEEICLREWSWPLLAPGRDSGQTWEWTGRLLDTGNSTSVPDPHTRLSPNRRLTSCSTQRSLEALRETNQAWKIRPTRPRCPRPISKRMPRKIRYARPVACQGGPSLRKHVYRVETIGFQADFGATAFSAFQGSAPCPIHANAFPAHEREAVPSCEPPASVCPTAGGLPHRRRLLRTAGAESSLASSTSTADPGATSKLTPVAPAG